MVHNGRYSVIPSTHVGANLSSPYYNGLSAKLYLQGLLHLWIRETNDPNIIANMYFADYPEVPLEEGAKAQESDESDSNPDPDSGQFHAEQTRIDVSQKIRTVDFRLVDSNLNKKDLDKFEENAWERADWKNLGAGKFSTASDKDTYTSDWTRKGSENGQHEKVLRLKVGKDAEQENGVPIRDLQPTKHTIKFESEDGASDKNSIFAWFHESLTDNPECDDKSCDKQNGFKGQKCAQKGGFCPKRIVGYEVWILPIIFEDESLPPSLILAEMIRCIWDESTLKHYDETESDLDAVVKHYFLDNAATPLFSNLLSYSPLGQPPKSPLTRDSEIYTFADSGQLDKGLAEMVKEFETRVSDLDLYSGYQLMIYQPEDRALFYRLLSHQVERLSEAINDDGAGQGGKTGSTKSSSVREIVGELLDTPGFKKTYCERYYELYGYKIDTKAAHEFAEGQDIPKPVELVRRLIECIPQFFGLGIAGECAESKFAYVIPKSIYRDFRRMHRKRDADESNPSVYHTYYQIMQNLEQYLNPSGTQRGLFIAPLIESGQARGVIFLFEDTEKEVDLHKTFIDSVAVAKKTSQALQDIRDQYYRECVFRDYIHANNKGTNPDTGLADLLIKHIHYVCNPQLAVSLRGVNLDGPLIDIPPHQVWSYEKHGEGSDGLWTGSSPDILGKDAVTNPPSKLLVKSELLDWLKTVRRRPNVILTLKMTEFAHFVNHKDPSVDLAVSSILAFPIIEANRPPDMLVVWFAEPVEIIKANLVGIWKKFSNLIVVHQYSMHQRRMELSKTAKTAIKMILESKGEYLELVDRIDLLCKYGNSGGEPPLRICPFCGSGECRAIGFGHFDKKSDELENCRAIAGILLSFIKSHSNNGSVAWEIPVAKFILSYEFAQLGLSPDKTKLEGTVIYPNLLKVLSPSESAETLLAKCNRYIDLLRNGLHAAINIEENWTVESQSQDIRWSVFLVREILTELNSGELSAPGSAPEKGGSSFMSNLSKLACIIKCLPENSM